MSSYNFKADEQLQAILHRNSEAVLASPGTIIFKEGEKARGMYLVVSGKIELLLHSAGLVSLIRRASAGCLVGVPASINHHPYSLTAKVVERAELRFIPVKTLGELMKSDPFVTMQLVNMLSEEVRAMRKVVAHPEQLVR
jgi:CRP/FNR family transcriptional regulator, polysaccharide utilization system transcription regulator